jgi:hypothetical protein
VSAATAADVAATRAVALRWFFFVMLKDPFLSWLTARDVVYGGRPIPPLREV